MLIDPGFVNFPFGPVGHAEIRHDAFDTLHAARNLVLLEAMRCTRLVNNGRNAGFRRLAAQAAVGPFAGNNDADAEMSREFHDLGIGDVRTDLGLVGSFVGRGMEVDQGIAVYQHLGERLPR